MKNLFDLFIQGFLIGAGVALWIKVEKTVSRSLRKRNEREDMKGLSGRMYDQVYSIAKEEIQHAIMKERERKTKTKKSK